MVSNWPLVGWYEQDRIIVLREQARSHRGNAFHCGSGLAREEASTGTENLEGRRLLSAFPLTQALLQIQRALDLLLACPAEQDQRQ